MLRILSLKLNVKSQSGCNIESTDAQIPVHPSAHAGEEFTELQALDLSANSQQPRSDILKVLGTISGFIPRPHAWQRLSQAPSYCALRHAVPNRQVAALRAVRFKHPANVGADEFNELVHGLSFRL